MLVRAVAVSDVFTADTNWAGKCLFSFGGTDFA
jgi:hypothetical protein